MGTIFAILTKIIHSFIVCVFNVDTSSFCITAAAPSLLQPLASPFSRNPTLLWSLSGVPLCAPPEPLKHKRLFRGRFSATYKKWTSGCCLWKYLSSNIREFLSRNTLGCDTQLSLKLILFISCKGVRQKVGKSVFWVISSWSTLSNYILVGLVAIVP